MRLIALIAALSVSSCGPGPTSQDTEGRSPQSVTMGSPVIDIRKEIEASTDDGYILQAAIATKSSLAGIGEIRTETKEVRIHYATQIADKFGQVAKQELFRLSFSAADLRKTNFHNLSDAETLDLASEYRPSSEFGAAVVSRACGDPEGPLSPHLCSLRASIPAE